MRTSDDEILGQFNDDVETDVRGVDYEGLTIAGLDFSTATLSAQVVDGYIDLSPAFQRRDAWNDQKRSRFIESLILHVPIPQIVLAEAPPRSGRYVVLDGRQRLMTIAGVYAEGFRRWKTPKFQDLYELTYLNGVELQAFSSSERNRDDFQRFRTASIRCSVLSNWHSRDVLYDIFFRLNSGSVRLTGQELRQVFYAGPFAEFLFRKTEAPNLIRKVLRVQEPDPRFADIELYLRLLAFLMSLQTYRGDMKAFLDDTMQRLNSEWTSISPSVESEFADIDQALATLGQVVGNLANAGRRPVTGDAERFDGRFNRALFEVQAYYFVEYRPEIDEDAVIRYREMLLHLLSDTDFAQSIESTTKSTDRVRTRFEKYRKALTDVMRHQYRSMPDIA